MTASRMTVRLDPDGVDAVDQVTTSLGVSATALVQVLVVDVATNGLTDELAAAARAIDAARRARS